MKILTAEDEVYMNEMYRDTLEPLGHQIKTTESAEKCITEYKNAMSKETSSPFDIVIIDYLMPEKNGVVLAKEILAENPNQRIIFVSAHGNLISEEIKEIKGNVELMSKPVSVMNLAAKIEGVSQKEIAQKLQGS